MTTTPLDGTTLTVCHAAHTARLLGFAELMAAIAQAARDYEDGAITSPERQVLPLGAGGVLLSMPATAHDIGIHKLVNVQPANAERGLPTIHGTVTVCDAATGKPLCLLDGPELTGRRTAAVTLLALQALGSRPLENILLFGTGTQARHHVRALHAIHPGAVVWVKSRSDATSAAFCAALQHEHAHLRPALGALPADIDAVITVTTSTQPIYDEPAQSGRVVVGVGAFKPEMAEIGPRTLGGSALFADDPAGARHEAGDLLRAQVDWARVRSLGALLRDGAGTTGPTVFKSVGSAAWDLAAGRVALRALQGAA